MSTHYRESYNKQCDITGFWRRRGLLSHLIQRTSTPDSLCGYLFAATAEISRQIIFVNRIWLKIRAVGAGQFLIGSQYLFLYCIGKALVTTIGIRGATPNVTSAWWWDMLAPDFVLNTNKTGIHIHHCCCHLTDRRQLLGSVECVNSLISVFNSLTPGQTICKFQNIIFCLDLLSICTSLIVIFL